jgi:hypothetical protein
VPHSTKEHLQPVITIVMPVYNGEKTIADAIESILAQQAEEWELIIVNDGSTDATSDIVEPFLSDPRIRLICQPNSGVAASRNTGVSAATGDIVAFLDDDDQWHREYLTTIRKLRDEFPTCNVFATSYLRQERNASTAYPAATAVAKRGETRPCKLEAFFLDSIAGDPLFFTGSVAVDRKCLIAAGLFPVGVAAGEDLLTWARLAAKYEIAYSPRPLVTYHPPSIGETQLRIPIDHDPVGDGLAELAQSTDDNALQDKIRQYCGYWHKMRASILLERDMPKAARPAVRRAMSYGRPTMRLAVYFCLCHLPSQFAGTTFRALLHWARRRRVRRGTRQ